MDVKTKDRFMKLWRKYFNGAESPITFYYTDREGCAEPAPPPSGHRCLICDLARVRKGESLYFDIDSLGCGGAKRYTGFTQEIIPNFEYFLSCGIPGKLEGERYKKSPELVREAMKRMPEFEAPAQFIVFKRWDKLEKSDEPEVVIFFAPPDVLSGLFTLASFDEVDPHGVFVPFSAGCGSIVQYPYLEKDSHRPRAVLGMFDVSARPCVPENVLTFAVPMNKFLRMINNTEESFLITASWTKVNQRISRAGKQV
ncbi:MAG: hypothetical protein GTO24_06140 [candidate division Zixibacteria bacterium]|nr:hypothetical protein [candidate division Zixibacteria bacterium]